MPAPETRRPTLRRRRRWISLIIIVIVIAADVGITLLFAQAAPTQTVLSAAEVTWLSRLLLAIPPLMMLALVFGELLAFRAYRRRPLLLSPDLALARHAYARLRDQSAQASRGFTITAVGLLAMAQYGVIATLYLWQPRPSDQSYIPIPFGFELAYLGVYFVCLVVSGFTRMIETYRSQPSPPAATLTPRHARGALR